MSPARRGDTTSSRPVQLISAGRERCHVLSRHAATDQRRRRSPRAVPQQGREAARTPSDPPGNRHPRWRFRPRLPASLARQARLRCARAYPEESQIRRSTADFETYRSEAEFRTARAQFRILVGAKVRPARTHFRILVGSSARVCGRRVRSGRPPATRRIATAASWVQSSATLDQLCSHHPAMIASSLSPPGGAVCRWGSCSPPTPHRHPHVAGGQLGVPREELGDIGRGSIVH